ncbi:MFS transporter, partial [Candidatus Woesearchaeota archaeon]|nr:MFS transporter [Candidatus Woesearchaeota archaeon]
MKIFEKGELRILWPFYLERVISHIMFFAPAFWTLQMQQNLSLSQIGILWAVYSVILFFFEIPTGAFADIYGRKASTLFGYLICGFSLIGLFFAKQFYVMAVLFFAWASGITFISGAMESWIVDRLKAKKKQHLVSEYYIKNHSLIGFGLFFSGILGAYVV